MVLKEERSFRDSFTGIYDGNCFTETGGFSRRLVCLQDHGCSFQRNGWFQQKAGLSSGSWLFVTGGTVRHQPGHRYFMQTPASQAVAKAPLTTTRQAAFSQKRTTFFEISAFILGLSRQNGFFHIIFLQRRRTRPPTPTPPTPTPTPPTLPTRQHPLREGNRLECNALFFLPILRVTGGKAFHLAGARTRQTN